MFLGYVAVAALGYFGAAVVAPRELRSTNRLESVVSREASFLLNNWVFMAILVIVFWGTLFPVFSEGVRGTQDLRGPRVLQQADRTVRRCSCSS